MPTVKDKTSGDVVSRQPYTAEGTQRAEQIAESDPTWEIDYAPGGQQDASARNESYQLGGLIPGQEGFGQNPMMKPPLPQPGQSTDNRFRDMAKKLTGFLGYEKGGKVGRKRKSSKFTPEQEKIADEALKQEAKNVKEAKQGKKSHKDYKFRQKQILRRMKSHGIK